MPAHETEQTEKQLLDGGDTQALVPSVMSRYTDQASPFTAEDLRGAFGREYQAVIEIATIPIRPESVSVMRRIYAAEASRDAWSVAISRAEFLSAQHEDAGVLLRLHKLADERAGIAEGATNVSPFQRRLRDVVAGAIFAATSYYLPNSVESNVALLDLPMRTSMLR